MSGTGKYWRIGVQVYEFTTTRDNRPEGRQIGLANNVHLAQRIVDALNAQVSK